MNTTDTFEAFWETQCRSLPVEDPKELARAMYERFRAEMDQITPLTNGDIRTVIKLSIENKELRAELEKVKQEREWTYCPECGSEEIRYSEDEHKQCGKCYQEWFLSIDYSEVVRQNLATLRASLAQAQKERDNYRLSVRDLAQALREKIQYNKALKAELESAQQERDAAKREAQQLMTVGWWESYQSKRAEILTLKEQLAAAQQEAERLRDLLLESQTQIEYLHDKFQQTGSGNAVIARIEAALRAHPEPQKAGEEGQG